MSQAVPLVKITDYCDLFGIRSPHSKPNTMNPGFVHQVRTKHPVTLVMRAFPV